MPVPWSVRAPVALLLTVRTVPPGLARSGSPPGSAPDSQVNPRLDRLIVLPKRCCRLDGIIHRELCSCCYVTTRHCTTCSYSQLTVGQRLDVISSVGDVQKCKVSGLASSKDDCLVCPTNCVANEIYNRDSAEPFHYQLMHIMLKNTELLKHSKIMLQHVSVYIETIFRELKSVLG